MGEADDILREQKINQDLFAARNPEYGPLKFLAELEAAQRMNYVGYGGGLFQTILEQKRDEVRRAISQAQNPFADLFATWVLFKDEPGMDDILEKAGDMLDKMFEFYKIYPVNIDGARKLYLARFELVKFQEDPQYPRAKFITDMKGGEYAGFVHFLSGFPMDTPEALIMIGEISSRAIYKAGKLPVMDGKGEITSPVPDNLFSAFDDTALLLNYLYLETNQALVMADNLDGEPDAQQLHWWVATNFLTVDEIKFPYPGEFFSLGIRMMPDKYWDKQESSPFLFAGCFLDTIYYSSGIIKEKTEPTDEFPFFTYKVQWRKNTYSPCIATDFTEYNVDDRVVLLKNVETEKTSQLWKDDDMDPDKNDDLTSGKWSIAPMMFYGYDPEKDETVT